jgi:hypothetical protein
MIRRRAVKAEASYWLSEVIATDRSKPARNLQTLTEPVGTEYQSRCSPPEKETVHHE